MVHIFTYGYLTRLVIREINISYKLKASTDNGTHTVDWRKFKLFIIPNVC